MNFRHIGAQLRKDFRSLSWLALFTALLFAGDVVLREWPLSHLWLDYRQAVLLLACALLTIAVFQLDSAASLIDDWLCRPIAARNLVAAKLVFLCLFIYLPACVAQVAASLALGRPLAEALQEGVLLQDWYFSLLLPTLVFTAMVTRTVVQAIGVFVALFACLFVLPTPLVQAPDPLSPAIGPALAGVGLEWMATLPAKLVPMGLLVIGMWLVYGRRRILAARILLACTAGTAALMFMLPMWLVPWESVFAAQRTLAPAVTPGDARDIHLRPLHGCFPATRLGELAGDAAFNGARESLRLARWTDEDLRDSGPDAIAFLTSVEARRLPGDARVKLNFVQADYHADGDPRPLLSLRPVHYLTGNGSALSHAWVLPARALRQLEGHRAALTLRYSLTLLEPRAYRLAIDGDRHALPGLGACSAELTAAGDFIDVECFSAADLPAQLSAELDGIPATRAYSPADFSPAWAQWPYTRRVQLRVGSPRLSTHDTITVTKWTVAGYLDRAIELPGVLGADTSACPLPVNGHTPFQQSRWRDAAPHEAASISVQDGVQLEVLDFGGQGSPILLLPGLGATAHSFDELAPQLARQHRVVALTRRGAGFSSRPDFGFDTPRLAQDVLQVMNAMNLGRVLLVGHSIAGDELTWLGGHHPERFSGLVYLDAAYDRSQEGEDTVGASRLRTLQRMLPPEPPIPPDAFRNLDTLAKLLADRRHLPVPEGELIAFHQVDKPWLAGQANIDPRARQAIVAALQPPDYGSVQVPALALYALGDAAVTLPPWYERDDPGLRATMAEVARLRRAAQRADIVAFRRGMRDAEVLEIPDARHYIIQSNPQDVLTAIEKFAARLR